MKKGSGILLISFTVAIFALSLIFLLIRLSPEPPDKNMENARKALSKAVGSKADTYSKKLYSESENYYDSAMFHWQLENRRFIYLRDYEKVEMFAKLSLIKANQASENAVISSKIFDAKLKQKIIILNDLISDINSLFTNYPLSFEIRNKISSGKLLLKEAEIAYLKRQFLQANRKITESEYLLNASYEHASSNLINYFKGYLLWKKWIDKTIAESKRNNVYSIIIDKFSRKCIVYFSGVKKYEFEAELGKNWVGDKRIKGDMATPEGMYKITKKIEGSRTKYYKALLLDYPNGEDIKRFKNEIETGLLPAYAKIGSLIEIHGNGGKGIDWTEGCVALADNEMDIVYKICRVGTPVTIVGSMVDLKYIVKR